jgi:hypothetical protein
MPLKSFLADQRQRKRPDQTSMRLAAAPMAAQTGTASATSRTNSRTGP